MAAQRTAPWPLCRLSVGSAPIGTCWRRCSAAAGQDFRHYVPAGTRSRCGRCEYCDVRERKPPGRRDGCSLATCSRRCLTSSAHDTAFINRLHFFLPGWEIPKMRNDLFTDHYELLADASVALEDDDSVLSSHPQYGACPGLPDLSPRVSFHNRS